MDACKCDRCGGYYIPKCENWDKIHIMKAHYNGVVKGKTYFDLCPDCMGALREWLLANGVMSVEGAEND